MTDIIGFLKFSIKSIKNNIWWVLYFIFMLCIGIFLPLKIAGILYIIILVGVFLYASYNYYISTKKFRDD